MSIVHVESVLTAVYISLKMLLQAEYTLVETIILLSPYN